MDWHSPAFNGVIIQWMCSMCVLKAARPAPRGPMTARPAPRGPMTPRPAPRGPMTARPAPRGPMTARPAPRGPMTARPAPRGPMTARPAPRGPMTARPAPRGPMTARPAPRGPMTSHQISMSTAVDVILVMFCSTSQEPSQQSLPSRNVKKTYSAKKTPWNMYSEIPVSNLTVFSLIKLNIRTDFLCMCNSIGNQISAYKSGPKMRKAVDSNPGTCSLRNFSTFHV